MNFNKRQTRLKTISHIPGLDGLRAFAVAAVIAYHLGLPFIPGGFLGVDLFFVLSGFLITSILLTQSEQFGYIDLGHFWIRRARRLLPALFLMLACVTVWLLLFVPGRMAAIWPEIPAAMFYYSNWFLIFHDVSYFEQFGPPSPFGHLWSLAIEEQFYILWPIFLGLFLRFFKKNLTIAITIAAILSSAAAMFFLYTPGDDPSRVYYGTDTRAFALLMGALVAMLLSGKRLPETLSFKKQALLEVSGIAGLFAALLMIFKINQYDSITYQGLLLLFSIAAACLVAVLAHPASRLSKLLGQGPLRWIGECSYGIYLWHFPVIVLTSPPVNTGGVSPSLSLVQVALTVILAALSRHFVEEPIRYGLRRVPVMTFSRPRKHLHSPARKALKHAVKTLSMTLVILSILFVSTEESNQPFAVDHLDQVIESELEVEIEEEEEIIMTGDEITVIGDSLMVGVEPFLKERLPDITVDAKISRQMRQAPDVILNLEKISGMKSTVIIELGTNGPFTESQLVNVIDSLESAERIIFINARVPKHWESLVNETLEKVLSAYPKTILIDWYSASRGHDEYFYDDGVHLRPVGAEAYCSLIMDAL